MKETNTSTNAWGNEPNCIGEKLVVSFLLQLDLLLQMGSHVPHSCWSWSVMDELAEDAPGEVRLRHLARGATASASSLSLSRQ